MEFLAAHRKAQAGSAGPASVVVYPGSTPPPPATASVAVDPVSNPYARGRVPGGTMPHPTARFEVYTEDTQAPVGASAVSSPINPYARGRVPGGTMPHPSLRFDVPPGTPESNGGETSGQRGKNPPGGKTNIVLG